jgi:hypothetical protein
MPNQKSPLAYRHVPGEVFLSISIEMGPHTCLGCDSVESMRRFMDVQKNKEDLPEKNCSDAALCIFIWYCIFLAVFFATNTLQIHK